MFSQFIRAAAGSIFSQVSCDGRPKHIHQCTKNHSRHNHNHHQRYDSNDNSCRSVYSTIDVYPESSLSGDSTHEIVRISCVCSEEHSGKCFSKKKEKRPRKLSIVSERKWNSYRLIFHPNFHSRRTFHFHLMRRAAVHYTKAHLIPLEIVTRNWIDCRVLNARRSLKEPWVMTTKLSPFLPAHPSGQQQRLFVIININLIKTAPLGSNETAALVRRAVQWTWMVNWSIGTRTLKYRLPRMLVFSSAVIQIVVPKTLKFEIIKCSTSFQLILKKEEAYTISIKWCSCHSCNY